MAVSLHALGIVSEPHRFQILRVQPSLFVKMVAQMDGTKLIRCEGLPVDAKVVSTNFDYRSQTIEMVIESAEFFEVNEGMQLPELTITTTVTQGISAIVNELYEREKVAVN